ncbi:MAG TPA: 3-deoxy-D-manno-octulosonic acid transferase [Nitrospiraceae bacterium]|jgi:3-deoxy-D-manno-octulosonic-acid transferase|nr:3-deoxy-D-manno-octulosonic acid transferase [Nitrospiraceae bacterium]
MWRLFYNIVLLVVSPVIVAVLLAKRRCRRGLLQRLGLEEGSSGLSRLFGLVGFFEQKKLNKPDQPNKPDKPVIWVHAVSLGEVVAVTPLVNELRRRHPECRLVVSTVTETGREAVEQRLAGVADHCYAPLDFPWVVSRFIERLQPCLYLFVETELWPNLLWHLGRRGVPTVLVNGRLSTRSFARQQWAPVRSFYRPMLQALSLCLMQSDRDVDRIIALGAEVSRVRRTGNIKFDQPIPAITERGTTRAHLGLHETEQLFMAGSTHPGEEETLVECYRSLVTQYPSAVLLLAPRHIERAESVEAMIRARGLSVQRRSNIRQAGALRSTGPRVVVLDSRGELAAIYREAVVAFVGGTLVPIGGHNLLEPAQWAKPVLFGPYTDHCAEIADLLIQAGGGRRVLQAEDLTQQMMALFSDDEERKRMGRSARQVVEQNQGALQQTLEAIDRLLTPQQGTSGSPLADRPLPLMAGR